MQISGGIRLRKLKRRLRILEMKKGKTSITCFLERGRKETFKKLSILSLVYWGKKYFQEIDVRAEVTLHLLDAYLIFSENTIRVSF